MYQTSTVYHIFTFTKQGHLHPKGHPRDQLVLNLEKIRDTTSITFTMSHIKRTECITVYYLPYAVAMDLLNIEMKMIFRVPAHRVRISREHEHATCNKDPVF